jgi:Flp pilus assembly protein CpaB
MRKTKFIIMTSLLVIALLITEIVIVKSVSKYEPEFTVLYAKVRIPAKTVITPEMLLERKINISLIHRQAYRNSAELTGKKVKADIEEGEMILSSRIGSPDEMQEIQVIDKSSRLYTIEFKPDQANGWWLAEGQHVDLLFIPREKTGTPQKLYGIRIAALIDDKRRLVKANDASTIPKYISFEVTTSQYEFLADAKDKGRIELSVVPANDNEEGE